MVTYAETCGLAPSRALGGLNHGAGGWEHATVRPLPTGKAEVVSGSTPHGQGHETTWSQIVGDKLGIPPEDVTVFHSDTAISPLGLDTYGSLARRRRCCNRCGLRQGRREGQADRRPPDGYAG